MRDSSVFLVGLTASLLIGGAGLARAEEPAGVVKSITLEECIEQALAQNLEIQVERVTPRIADWGIVREQSAFEPVLNGRISYSDAAQPLTPEEARSVGLPLMEQRQLQFGSDLIGKLPTGTAYDLSALETRYSGSLVSNYSHLGTVALTLTQPLLKNRGLGPNTAGLRIARKDRQIATELFRQRVIDTISTVNNAYYDLVHAIEDQKAKVEDLNRARTLLDQNKKLAEAGLLSPIEVTQAEAGAAEREEAVIVAEQAVRDRENLLKRLISQDVLSLDNVSLVPVDYPVAEMVEVDARRSIRTALDGRPDFLQAKHELERRGILLKYTQNLLLPQIDLQGSYGLNGQGSNYVSFADNLASRNNPQWSVGVVVSVPLGNRRARADYFTAREEEQRALLNLKRLEQDIVVQVGNAVGQVRTNLKRMDATRAARRLAEESLRAEGEKLRAGDSTSLLVLQAQSQLAEARSAEIRAKVDYNRSLVELERVEGSALQKHHVELVEDSPVR